MSEAETALLAVHEGGLRLRSAAGVLIVTSEADFVDILVRNVEETMRAGGRFLGAQVGSVLRKPYAEAGRPIAKGAYRSVIEAAIAGKRLRRLFPEAYGGGDILVPFEAPAPPGYQESPSTTASRSETEGARLGLPSGSAFLWRDLYRAFAGLDQPRFADPSSPPRLRIDVAQGEHGILVEPVPPAEVQAWWDEFSKEHDIPAPDQVRSHLGTTEGAWSKLAVPGDDPTKRWSATFHVRRIDGLLLQIKTWAEKHGIDLGSYQLVQPPRSASPEGAPVARIAADHTDRADELRRRLKRAIDRMTMQQLCELRVPAEFLLD